MYKRLKECGRHTEQYRKSIALVAAMRLRRKQPNDSLEILSIHDDTDVNIRYIRILAHSYLQQFDDVLRLLKMTISSNKTILIPDQLVNTFSIMTVMIISSWKSFKIDSFFSIPQLQKIEGKMKRLPDGNKITEEYKLIYNELKELNLIFYKVKKIIKSFTNSSIFFLFLMFFFCLFRNWMMFCALDFQQTWPPTNRLKCPVKFSSHINDFVFK